MLGCWLAGWVACCLLAGWLLAAGCWLLAAACCLLACWLAPRGHTAYNNRLLEAVKYDIYKLKAYKLRRLRKIVR